MSSTFHKEAREGMPRASSRHMQSYTLQSMKYLGIQTQRIAYLKINTHRKVASPLFSGGTCMALSGEDTSRQGPIFAYLASIGETV